MKTQKIMAILFVLAAATGCGRQLVEFPETDAAAFADTAGDNGNLDSQPLDTGSDIVAGTDVAQTDIAVGTDATETDIAVGTDAVEGTDIVVLDIGSDVIEGSDIVVLDIGTDAVEGTDVVTLDIGTDAVEGTDVVALDIGTDAVEGTDVVTIDIGTDAVVGTDVVVVDIEVGTDVAAGDTFDLDAIGDLGILPDLGDAEPADIADMDLVLLPIAPTVVEFTPVDGAQGVTTTVEIAIVFSEPMDPHTLNVDTITVFQGLTKITGEFFYVPQVNSVVFVPDSPLLVDLTYDVTITTAVTDLDGTPMAEEVTFSFSTEDLSPPQVMMTTPENGANAVNINSDVFIVFSKPMDPLTIDENSVIVMQGLNSVTGVVTYDELTWTATFTPDVPFAVGLSYDASVTVDAIDLNGVALAQDHTWTFSTDACGMEPLTFTALADVAILGYSTITNSGIDTLIKGDVRLSPGTAIEGLPAVQVDGDITANTPADAAARADMLQAYTDGDSRTLCAQSAEGNLGGATFYPGLYEGVKMSITSGTLTLDANGDANAVFIFQMSETLTTTDGMQMVLTNGANPERIYWIVGSSATFGTNSVFYGNVMAHVSISLNTGATVIGRLMAYTGGVTLLGNKVTLPSKAN